MGLAWTPTGGDLLFIEATAMRGTKGLTLTGQLGDVMKESGRAALSYAKAQHEHLGITAEALEDREVHIHVPAGAIPKDGPSAGITMATALVSGSFSKSSMTSGKGNPTTASPPTWTFRKEAPRASSFPTVAVMAATRST